jgi:hypothetical protein
MIIHRPLMLATMAVQLFAGAALAADGGIFILAPGEVRAVSVGSTDREIHVCNDLGNTGDLVVIIADHDPFLLAPGICKWGHGGRITLRNDSKSIVSCFFQVTGKHQS